MSRPLGHHGAGTARRPRRERGSALVLTGFVIVPLLLVAALVIDVGFAKDQRRIAQSSADAAALAAAQELDGGSDQLTRAVSQAKVWAAKNVAGLTAADWVGCTDPDALAIRPDVSASDGCISFDSSAAPTKVRVRIPASDQPRFFGQLGSNDALRVTASAVAARGPGGPAPTPAGPCGLCLIGGKRLQMAGDLKISVIGGRIQADRLTANMQDNNLNVTPVPLGYYNANENSNWGRNYHGSNPAYAFAARYQQLPAPVPNPFDGLTVSYAGLTTTGQNLNLPNGSQTIQPDVIYTQNVNINGGTITLAPNRTYYFANTLNMNGGRLVGQNVTLVFGCTSTCNNQERGKINVGSNATVEITAPTSGPYAGLAILFDPTATGQGNNLNGKLSLEGAVYARKAGLNTSSSTVLTAWTVVSGENSNFNGGTIEIDNTKYYSGGGGGGSGGGAGGEISLVG